MESINWIWIWIWSPRKIDKVYMSRFCAACCTETNNNNKSTTNRQCHSGVCALRNGQMLPWGVVFGIVAAVVWPCPGLTVDTRADCAVWYWYYFDNKTPATTRLIKRILGRLPARAAVAWLLRRIYYTARCIPATGSANNADSRPRRMSTFL